MQCVVSFFAKLLFLWLILTGHSSSLHAQQEDHQPLSATTHSIIRLSDYSGTPHALAYRNILGVPLHAEERALKQALDAAMGLYGPLGVFPNSSVFFQTLRAYLFLTRRGCFRQTHYRELNEELWDQTHPGPATDYFNFENLVQGASWTGTSGTTDIFERSIDLARQTYHEAGTRFEAAMIQRDAHEFNPLLRRLREIHLSHDASTEEFLAAIEDFDTEARVEIIKKVADVLPTQALPREWYIRLAKYIQKHDALETSLLSDPSKKTQNLRRALFLFFRNQLPNPSFGKPGNYLTASRWVEQTSFLVQFMRYQLRISSDEILPFLVFDQNQSPHLNHLTDLTNLFLLSQDSFWWTLPSEERLLSLENYFYQLAQKLRPRASSRDTRLGRSRIIFRIIKLLITSLESSKPTILLSGWPHHRLLQSYTAKDHTHRRIWSFILRTCLELMRREAISTNNFSLLRELSRRSSNKIAEAFVITLAKGILEAPNRAILDSSMSPSLNEICRISLETPK